PPRAAAPFSRPPRAVGRGAVVDPQGRTRPLRGTPPAVARVGRGAALELGAGARALPRRELVARVVGRDQAAHVLAGAGRRPREHELARVAPHLGLRRRLVACLLLRQSPGRRHARTLALSPTARTNPWQDGLSA